MYILIGDIGNTVTKLCLVDVRTYKLNNIVYLSSKGILNKKILKNTFKKIFSKKNIIHSALFSSVVPLYENKIKIYHGKCLVLMNKIFFRIFFCQKQVMFS